MKINNIFSKERFKNTIDKVKRLKFRLSPKREKIQNQKTNEIHDLLQNTDSPTENRVTGEYSNEWKLPQMADDPVSGYYDSANRVDVCVSFSGYRHQFTSLIDDP